MNVYKNFIIGSDHAGFKVKDDIINYFSIRFPDTNIIDVGTYTEDSCDFPDYANKVADELKFKNNDSENLGILICGTGIGMSMAVNRYKHIRGALIHNEFTADLAKSHSNANVLIFGARVIDTDLAIKCINIFLNAEFDNLSNRHIRRLTKIS